MRSMNWKRPLLGTAILGAVMGVGAISAQAQDRGEEYREWQRAQRAAEEEYRDYIRTRSRRDYRDWQQAQRRAQQEYREYQRASRTTYNAGRGSGYGYGRRYRVYRDGRYYETDNRGAELLRQAVNRGYQQGYVAGQRDRRNGRDFDYDDQVWYRRANYGYQSWVTRDQYEYYFREGFRRGYEDGYYSTSRYGYRSGNNWSILGSVLGSILNITPY